MDIQAALGIHQLASWTNSTPTGPRSPDSTTSWLAEIPELLRPGSPPYDHRHTWHLYVPKVLEAAGLGRDLFMAALRERGIGSGLHFRAVHTQPLLRRKIPHWSGAPPECRVGFG